MSSEYADYKVIAHHKVNDNEEIALGFNPIAQQPYAIWDCVDEENYYNGKYFVYRRQAIKEFMHQVSIIEHDVFNANNNKEGGRAM